MPMSKEARRDYQRIYMRELRRKAKESGLQFAHLLAKNEQINARQIENSRLNIDGRAVLKLLLQEHGLTIERLILKLLSLLDAKKLISIGKVPTEVNDNDAQLRAIELSTKLLERAAAVPMAADRQATGDSVTVNVLVMPDKKKSANLKSPVINEIEITPSE